jgi:hypothetical protein
MKCSTKRMAEGGKVREDNMPDWAKQQLEDKKLSEGSERAYNAASKTPPAPKKQKYARGGGIAKRGVGKGRMC